MDLKTVSRIVKELESDLGFILFDRSCRPFKLTEGAEKILPLAKELLRTTTFKSYEIGEMVGYRNAEHFTRMFKKEAGCTPAQYRKQGE